MKKFIPLVLLIGAVIGALLTFSVLNAQSARHAWARGMMNVLAHHHHALKVGLSRKLCASHQLPAQSLRMLPVLHDEIPLSMADQARDFAFQHSLKELQTGIAMAAKSGDCKDLSNAIQTMSSACQSCHARFK